MIDRTPRDSLMQRCGWTVVGAVNARDHQCRQPMHVHAPEVPAAQLGQHQDLADVEVDVGMEDDVEMDVAEGAAMQDNDDSEDCELAERGPPPPRVRTPRGANRLDATGVPT